MSGLRFGRVGAAIVVATSVALAGASCAPGALSYSGPPVIATSFRATSVTVLDQTEHVYFAGCINCYDEPYLINIHFRVAFSSPGSASTEVVSTRSFSPEIALCVDGLPGCSSGAATSALTAGPGGSGAETTDTNVAVIDLIDVANNKTGLVVVGNWVWAMEEDLVGTLTPGGLAGVLTSALNATIAASTVPDFTNGQAVKNLILDSLGNAFTLGAAGLLSAFSGLLLGAGDDLISSRMYLRVGAYGFIANLIDSASLDLAGFNAGVSAIGIPAVQSVSVRSMGSGHSYIDDAFTSPDNDNHDNSAPTRYAYTFVDG